MGLFSTAKPMAHTNLKPTRSCMTDQNGMQYLKGVYTQQYVFLTYEIESCKKLFWLSNKEVNF
jgi:hypothetical protein